MLILLTAVFVTGTILMYLSHRHQRWIRSPLSPYWGWCGTAATVAVLFAGCNLYPPNTAVLTWIAGLMLIWGLLPFVPLLWSAEHRE